MGHDPDREAPFFFQKNPDNLDTSGKFPYPPKSSDVHHEVEIAVMLKSGGSNIALGSGMRVIAWNRTPKTYPSVEFVSLEKLLADSDVVSLHLLLNDETRGFLSRERIAAMKPGVILVNTARAAMVDEDAMTAALKSGHIRHAGLDVFNTEPLPGDHPLTKLRNVTLSAHSAFRTPEASENLIEAALQHCRRIAN
jgi:D-3-phosphoglycerate dehydrogenase